MNWNLAMGPNNQRSLTFRNGVKSDEFGGLKIWPFWEDDFSCWKKRRKPWNGGDFLENHQVVSAKNRQREGIFVLIFVQLWWLHVRTGMGFFSTPEAFDALKTSNMKHQQLGFVTLTDPNKKSFPPIPHQQPKSADTWKKYGNFSKDDLPQFFLGGASLGCLKRFAV